MARLLWDNQGNLRSFREWRELVTPIAAHQVGPWLETEYSTAVLRAQQAVEWQQFEAEADVLPNLRWVPSTAVHPGADHQVFWLLMDATKGSNTILPIHHPFWDQHRPGDRWLRSDVTEGNNCHCSLEATDEQPTAPPKGFELRGNGPQPGLNENPAKTGRLFAQSHPYFPQSCAQCAFYKGGIANGFKNQEKDCQNCRFIPILNEETINRERNEEIYKRLSSDRENYKEIEFDNESGGVKATHEKHSFDKDKGWYEKKVQEVGYKAGHAVILDVEQHNIYKGRNKEGLWDDKPFEIAGAENGTKTNIRNALKHCAKKPNVKIAVLFFPNNNFDAEEFNNGLSMYCGLEGTSQYKEFELIFCIQGDKIIHIKKAKH